MADRVLGIDCGNGQLKIAVCRGKRLERYVTAAMPDNIVRDGNVVSYYALGDFIRETIRENHIRGKNLVIALPEEAYYLRRVSLPRMTIQQLNVNLPFEFRDFLTGDKEDYVYDYAVLESDDKQMDLLAAATAKTVISSYKEMSQRAGLHLRGLVPDVLGLQNIILPHPAKTPLSRKDYAILDIGHGAIRLYFFSRGAYEITRTLDTGVEDLARQGAELLGIDIHIAQLYIERNQDDILARDQMTEEIEGMATEIMRVMNFYSYNNPDNTIDRIYYFGGGMQPDKLVQEVATLTALPVIPLTECISLQPGSSDELIAGPQAYGVVMQ